MTDEAYITCPDLLRRRIARETDLMLRRERVNERELALRIHQSWRVRASSRANGPMLTHRGISGLLEGKRCHLNTVLMVRDFILAAYGLPALVLDIPPDTVAVAKQYMEWMSRNNLSHETILAYEGIYRLAAYNTCAPTMHIVVDYEDSNNILLARATLLRNGNYIDEVEYLEGFAIPYPGLLQVHLRPLDRANNYVISVREGSRPIYVPALSRAQLPIGCRISPLPDSRPTTIEFTTTNYDTERTLPYTTREASRGLRHYAWKKLPLYGTGREHDTDFAYLDVFETGMQLDRATPSRRNRYF